MPPWFIVLAKVLSMLSYLIPQVEQTFGSAAGTGADKKQAVLARVKDWLETPQAGEANPSMDQQQKEAVLAFADKAVDHIVEAANAADAFPPSEVIEHRDPVVNHHAVDDDPPPWDLPRGGTPHQPRRR